MIEIVYKENGKCVSEKLPLNQESINRIEELRKENPDLVIVYPFDRDAGIKKIRAEIEITLKNVELREPFYDISKKPHADRYVGRQHRKSRW